jgi:hypothetical protein
LRLHARGSDVDLRPMTTSLDAGRRLAAELAALNDGRREAGLAGRVRLRRSRRATGARDPRLRPERLSCA